MQIFNYFFYLNIVFEGNTFDNVLPSIKNKFSPFVRSSLSQTDFVSQEMAPRLSYRSVS